MPTSDSNNPSVAAPEGEKFGLSVDTMKLRRASGMTGECTPSVMAMTRAAGIDGRPRASTPVGPSCAAR